MLLLHRYNENSMLLKVLQLAGLSQKESCLYLGLLHYGPQPASVLSKKVGFNRVTAYQTLEHLASKGIVSVQKRASVKHYCAESYQNIVAHLLHEQHKIQGSLDTLKNNLHLFENITNPINQLSDVRVFYGISGIQTIYQDVLDSEPDELLMFSHIHSFKLGMQKYVCEYFIPERVRRGIPTKILLPHNVVSDILTTNKKELRIVRNVKKGLFPIDATVILYNSKVGILSYHKDELFGTLVVSQPFYAMMHGLFEYSWKVSGRS